MADGGGQVVSMSSNTVLKYLVFTSKILLEKKENKQKRPGLVRFSKTTSFRSFR